MIVRNNRFFCRPLEDFEAGAMTSMHTRITKRGTKLRGTIYLRDCESEISLEFWAGDGARPGGRKRAAEMLGRIRDEIDAFMLDYDRAAADIED